MVRGARPLTPAMFHILLSLAGGERHGYGMMQDIARWTDGRETIGPGTLYRSIRHLLELGLIAECGERPDPAIDDERRRYYRITTIGLEAVRAEARRLEAIVRVARSSSVLNEGNP